MTNYYLTSIILSLFFSTTLAAQQMPIDFSESAENFSVWGLSTFAKRPSPTDSSNIVGEFFHGASAAEQGYFIDLTRPIDLNSQSTITLLFYAFDPNTHTVTLKLERGDNGNIQITNSISSQTTWSTMSFDFSTIGASGNYNRLTILIDNGNATPGTFLIDSIDDGSTPTNPNAIDVVYSDLVWSDEFDVDGAVNPTQWHHQTQVIIPGQGWANGELQHYTNRLVNSFVENGNLHIVAKRETHVDQGLTKEFTSARLNSKFAFTYGRVDVKAKLPLGNGTWPAIWTLGKNINERGAYWQTQGFGTTSWPACGEIDIMEHGLHAPNHTSSAIHTTSSSGSTVNSASQEISDVVNNYHVYSLNWSPNQITFLVDNIPYYTYNPTNKNASTWPFSEDQFLLLNVALGGVAGSVDAAFSQSSMIIDYVRIYQNQELKTTDLTQNKVHIYPNPVKSILHIKSKLSIDAIEVYNVLGKLVLKQAGQAHVNTQGLNKGVYFVTIIAGNSRVVKKVVKH